MLSDQCRMYRAHWNSGRIKVYFSVSMHVFQTSESFFLNCSAHTYILNVAIPEYSLLSNAKHNMHHLLALITFICNYNKLKGVIIYRYVGQ